MKKLLMLPIVVIITSCIPILGVNKINNIRDYSTVRAAKPVAVEKEQSPIDPMYSDSDILGCLGGIMVSIPVALVEGLFNILAGDQVNLKFSAELIQLVRSDVDRFVTKFTNISPDDFYQALGEETVKLLEYELVQSLNGVDSESYTVKKQKLAYAFLYFLKTGDDVGSYKFTFDGRDADLPIKSREVISFNGPNKISEAKEVGFCGYFRFYEVEIKTAFDNEIVCTSDNIKNKLHFSKLENGYSLTTIKNKKTEQFSLAFNEIDTEEKQESLKIISSKKTFSYPKFELNFDKRYNYVTDKDSGESHREIYPNSAERLDLEISTGFFKATQKLKNMHCREFGQFEY